MRRKARSVTAAAVTLLLAVGFLIGMIGCSLPSQPTEQLPKETYSTSDLLANLDTLQGPSSRSIAHAGKSVFSVPGGGRLSVQDLSAYLNTIKTGFSGAASSATRGKPYLVTAKRLTWGDSESGLMWVPFTWFRRAKFPVICYQHGTQVYRPMAPSRFNINPFSVFSSDDQTGAFQNYVECIVGALMASAGYIVVMPDYQGFGDSHAVHPFVTELLGNSVAGAVTAAKAALGGGFVKPDGKLFLTGYSEGGYATMVGSRALGDQVTATVACDGPYDLSGTMAAQMLSDQPPKVPWYLLYAASGYNAAYNLALATMLNGDGLAKIGLFDGNHTNAQIDDAVPHETLPRSFLTDSAIADLSPPDYGPIRTLLSQNDGWYDWVPSGPVVLIHCPQDDVIPIANRTAAVEALEAAHLGALVKTVDVSPVPFIDSLLGSIHTAAYPTAMLAAFNAIETINRSTF